MKKPDDRTFAVALSGGGHRATVFTLGGVVALVDLRLNHHVSQIASVSGGSITNAFFAVQPKDFAELESADAGQDRL